jgi:hypothetical protein
MSGSLRHLSVAAARRGRARRHLQSFLARHYSRTTESALSLVAILSTKRVTSIYPPSFLSIPSSVYPATDTSAPRGAPGGSRWWG